MSHESWKLGEKAYRVAPLFTDQFDKDLSHWTSMGLGSKWSLRDGYLYGEFRPDGSTIWLKPVFEGDLIMSFYIEMIAPRLEDWPDFGVPISGCGDPSCTPCAKRLFDDGVTNLLAVVSGLAICCNAGGGTMLGELNGVFTVPRVSPSLYSLTVPGVTSASYADGPPCIGDPTDTGAAVLFVSQFGSRAITGIDAQGLPGIDAFTANTPDWCLPRLLPNVYTACDFAPGACGIGGYLLLMAA